MSGNQLDCIDYKRPKLPAGNYTINIKHRLGDPGNDYQERSTGQLELTVQGQKISINQALVNSTYPPAGDRGDFSATLPHVVLEKPTLPWIRSADNRSPGQTGCELPWLYLLVINDQDIANGDARAPVTIAPDALTQGAFFPTALAQSLQQDPTLLTLEGEPVAVDIKYALFRQLIADKPQQLEKLAHARRQWVCDESYPHERIDPEEIDQLNQCHVDALINNNRLPATTAAITPIIPSRRWLISDSRNDDYLLYHNESENLLEHFRLDKETSVLMANRFAQSDNDAFPHGTRNHALLVSLEGYFNGASGIDSVNDEQFVRLLVLHQWSFDCISASASFAQRASRIQPGLLSNASRLQEVPLDSSTQLQINQGFCALPHDMRLGDRSISWYRGPLSPCMADANGAMVLTEQQRGQSGTMMSATDADKLLRYHTEAGMFDISYAAAYELGRFLSTGNSEFRKALCKYKRAQSRHIKLLADDQTRQASAASRGIIINNMPYTQLTTAFMTETRQPIIDWLLALASLEPLPSWYLLPDPSMLADHSLNIFAVDMGWIQSLWLGALSIGGRPRITYNLFESLYHEQYPNIARYGILLRSDIVSAYPQLAIEFRKIPGRPVSDKLDLAQLQQAHGITYYDSLQPLPVSSQQSLTPDTELLLVKSPFNTITLALPPESQHYGATLDNTDAITAYTKSLVVNDVTLGPINVPLYAPEKAIIDTQALVHVIQQTLLANEELTADYKQTLDKINGSRLGLLMLESEPKIQYACGGLQ